MMAPPRSAPVVLVTGCGEGGIGYALCLEFVRRGCKVYGTGVDMPGLASLQKHGVITKVLDITSAKQVDSVVREVVAEAGRIDILVNNAGIASTGPVTEAVMEHARRCFEINFWGLWLVTQAVGKVMIAQRSGTIVNMGSFASRGHPPFLAAYNTSKAAVESLSHTLRCEVQPYGVKVVYVAPTAVQSRLEANSAGLVAPKEVWDKGDFRPMQNAVHKVLAVVNTPKAWPADKLARKVVGAALLRRPPHVVLGGAQWRLLRFVTALPRSVLLWVMYKRLGMDALKKMPAPPPPQGAGGAYVV